MKRYWIMKTRADIDRKEYTEHYYDFIDPTKNAGNKVIALGWDSGPKKGKCSLDELVNFIKKRYYPEENKRAENRAKIAARTVWTFIHDMHEKDEVLLCKGFNQTQKEVEIYAFARITGPYWEHEECEWFKRKRVAEYMDVKRKKISRSVLSSLLNKKSLLKTIHKIDEERFLEAKAYLSS